MGVGGWREMECTPAWRAFPGMGERPGEGGAVAARCSEGAGGGLASASTVREGRGWWLREEVRLADRLRPSKLVLLLLLRLSSVGSSLSTKLFVSGSKESWRLGAWD